MVDQLAQAHPAVAHVKLGKEDRTVPAGETVVSVLKSELGVDPAQTLFLKDHGKRVPLANEQVIDIVSGMHFESIGGGGVS
jgi:hypothetical protein